jgi:hypothetical protein
MTVKHGVDSDLVGGEVVEDEVRKVVPKRPHAELKLAKALVFCFEQPSYLRLPRHEVTEMLECGDEVISNGVELAFDVVVDVTSQVFFRSSFPDQSACHSPPTLATLPTSFYSGSEVFEVFGRDVAVLLVVDALEERGFQPALPFALEVGPNQVANVLGRRAEAAGLGALFYEFPELVGHCDVQGSHGTTLARYVIYRQYSPRS